MDHGNTANPRPESTPVDLACGHHAPDDALRLGPAGDRAWENMVPDFVCYWAAGEAIASGHSPYEVGLQAGIQRRCGWDKLRDGLGKYDFLPYYYPPWFAAGCALSCSRWDIRARRSHGFSSTSNCYY